MTGQHQGRVVKAGEGSAWRFEIDVKDPKTGRRKRIIRRGFDTKREAQAGLRSFLAERDQGRARPGRTPTFGPWLGEWVNTLDEVKPSTRALYTTMTTAYIQPRLGGLGIDQITTENVVAFRADLVAAGLAPKTVANALGVLKRALRDAVDWGVISYNPAAQVKPPKQDRRPPKTWTAQQVARFMAHVDGDRLASLWHLLATTGLRRGEALALTWDDLDLDRGSLSVSKSVAEYSGRRFESSPKTDAGSRSIHLDPATVAALKAHRLRQLEERMAWGEGWTDTGLVFTREDGSPISPTWVTRQLPRLAEEAGVRRLTPHGLRHTWATLALRQGIHPKVVQSRLGHSSIQITLDRYSHVMEGMDEAAAAAVAGLIRW